MTTFNTLSNGEQSASGATQAAALSPVQDLLAQVHRDCARITDGNVATYIPELAKTNPDWFGVCLVTATGAIYEVGDTNQPFTIQSISKPFVYGLALEDNGRAAVLQKVGVEPTGDAFNSISLEPGTGRPRNPMINAGAIATAGLIAGRSQHTRFKRILDTFSLYAGRELELDEGVYRSESETGHRNRAISYMLRNFDILTSDPMSVAELYFQQCSIAVTGRDLGVMAATLANGGTNPITGKKALRGEYVESVLSVMGICGMYDYAGEWLYNVGMPAKSGVAGGVIAVLPGQFGIGVFSPRLDSHGNSVRGIRVCQELSRVLDLHLFNRPSFGRNTIRLKFTGADFSSSRVRTAGENRLLHEIGARVRVWQLQGHLTFTTAEVAVRDVAEHLDGADFFLLDFKRVLSLNECSCLLLFQLLRKFSALGKTLIFVEAKKLSLLRRYLRLKLGERFETDFHEFGDSDLALEWCEDELLRAALPSETSAQRCALKDFAALENFTREELDVIAALLKRRAYSAGETIITAGDAAGEMFLLASGRVSVFTPQDPAERTRLATFSPGMTFGEMAMIDRAPRSAMIVADTDVECELLAFQDFDRLDQTHPGIKIKLLQNLCLDLCVKLRKANRELSVFD